MGLFRRFGARVSGLAGSAEKFFDSRSGSFNPDVEIAGVDVLGHNPSAAYAGATSGAGRSAGRDDIFDIGAILRLRTFLYLIAATALFLFQIHNTLTIKELAKQNERLREQLRISTSIRTAQELRASELQSIHNISGYAQGLGLVSSAEPPVDLEP